MTAENFERYAQGKLGGYRSEVDADALWAKVAMELQPKKKRGFFWMWFGAGLVAFSLLGYLGMNSLLSENPISPKGTLAVAAVPENDNKENVSNETLNAAKSAVVTNYSEVENVTDEGRSKTNTSTNIIERKSSSSLSTKKELSIAERTPSQTVSSFDDELINQNEILINNTNATNVFMNNSSSKSAIVDTTDQGINQLDESPSTFPLILENKDEVQIEQEHVDIVSNDPVGSIMLKEEEEEKTLKVIDAPATPPVSSFARDLTIGFGIRGGLSNSITSFRTFDGGGDTIRNLRFNSETGLETLTFGIEGLVKHDIGFYASLGWDYSKYTRRMDFNENIVTIDSVQGVTKIYINPITMVETYDSGLVARTTTVSTVKEIYNTQQFYNIPITLGYAFGYENWSIGLEAGALVNLIVNTKGTIRDSENTFYNITSDDKDWFADKVGVSFRGALVLGYSFDDAFQIYFGPEFRSPIRIDDKFNPVEQEQTSLGFQLGARYWLAY